MLRRNFLAGLLAAAPVFGLAGGDAAAAAMQSLAYRTASVLSPGTAAFAVPGAKTATRLTTASTYQYHVHTSATAGTIVMATPGTCTGFIASGTNKLTVNGTFTPTTCVNLRAGVRISGAGIPAGATIVKADTRSGATPGNGQTGDYIVSFTAGSNIGTSGSPITITCADDRVATLPDLNGLADLTAQSASGGPRLCQDSNGTYFLKCDWGVGTGNAFASWLRNLTVTGLDASNFGVILVGRHINPPSVDFTTSNPVFVSLGAKENNNYNANVSDFFTTRNGHMTSYPVDYYNDPAYNKLFCGTQLSVMSRFVVTDDGVGGSNTSASGRTRICAVNRDTLVEAGKGPSVRVTGMQGFCVNSSANTIGGSGGHLDIYEIFVFALGEMGNRTQVLTRAPTALAETVANHKVPTITKSMCVLSDSVWTYGFSSYSNYLADGSGDNMGRFLTDPGSKWAVPPNVRVMNYTVPGHGVDVINNYLDTKGDGGGSPSSTFQFTTPLEPTHMFGSGNDYAIVALQHNFSAWPNSTWGGRYAQGTTNFGHDLYSGDYTASATVTVGANSNSFTSVTSQSGVITLGSVITPDSNWQDGLGVIGATPNATSATVTAFSTINRQATARSGVAANFVLKSMRSAAQALTSRGVKVHWFSNVWDAASRGSDQSALDSHILNDLVTDAGALMTVSNLAIIAVGGVLAFSTGWLGANGLFYNDLVHLAFLGKWNVFIGGDSGFGVGYWAQQLLLR